MSIAEHRGWSVRECYEKIDSVEFTLWRAFYERYGLPEVRQDYRIAINTAVTGFAKGKVEDYIPRFYKQEVSALEPWQIMRDQINARNVVFIKETNGG